MCWSVSARGAADTRRASTRFFGGRWTRTSGDSGWRKLSSLQPRQSCRGFFEDARARKSRDDSRLSRPSGPRHLCRRLAMGQKSKKSPSVPDFPVFRERLRRFDRTKHAGWPRLPGHGASLPPRACGTSWGRTTLVQCCSSRPTCAIARTSVAGNINLGSMLGAPRCSAVALSTSTIA